MAPFITLDVPLQAQHTCHGPGHSPALGWSRAALPTATTHVGWVIHNADGVVWSAWDAPAELEHLQARFPAAHAPPLQGQNHLGRQGWAPPCPTSPPTEEHPDTLTMEMFAFDRPTGVPPTEAPPRLLERLRRVARARATTALRVMTTP